MPSSKKNRDSRETVRPEAARGSGKELKLTQETIETGMDPALQSIVIGRGREKTLREGVEYTSADRNKEMVDVIAHLKNADGEVPGLQVVAKVGDGIVTGAVDAAKIEEVRKHPNVLGLKLADPIRPNLRHSIPDSRASQQQLAAGLPAGSGTIDGRGVIVGIVDYGGDFAHHNFLKADGTTRLLFLWDQNGGPAVTSPAPYGYGREFNAVAIDNALSQPDPYAALDYALELEEHGTHVMDIAAGNGGATGAPGMAPGADLIFVQLATLGDTSGEGNFGNSRRLLEAVDYIFRKAAELGRPAVINLSLGTHGGPHDGTTLVEKGFDALLSEPGRAIVISAGNSFERRSHASGSVPAGRSKTLRWQIKAGDQTANELEVWYPGDRELSLQVIHPRGQTFGPVRLGTTSSLRDGQGRVVAQLIHRRQDSGNGHNHIDLLMDSSLTGDWKVELTAVGQNVDFHSWIERDDDGQSAFHSDDADPNCTLGSISCGTKTIVVGSSTALTAGHELSSFSSCGPTRDGRNKPEISAPGQFVVAANSTTTGTTSMSGTSMAAPHVTGLVALIMQAAGRPLASEEITRFITSAAQKNPPQGTAWHPRYGAGRIHALAAIRAARGLPLPGDGDRQPAAATPAVRPDTTGEFRRFVTVLAETASRSGVRVKVDLLIEPVQPAKSPAVSGASNDFKGPAFTEGNKDSGGDEPLDFDDATLRVRQVLAAGLGQLLKNVKTSDSLEDKWHMDEQDKRDWKGPLEAEFNPRHGTLIDSDDLAARETVEGFVSVVLNSTPVTV